ncbi:MAG: damage-inducible protein DinB, partial [Acidobacteria bacterium]
LERLTDDMLGRRIAYQNLANQTWEYSLGQMMQHLMNHSTYHRGQIVTMLRQLGAKGVSTDYLLYFDEQSAAI